MSEAATTLSIPNPRGTVLTAAIVCWAGLVVPTPCSCREPAESSRPETSEEAGSSTLRRVRAYGELPLHFEPNRGQSDPSVVFTARQRGFALFLRRSEAVLVIDGDRSGAGREGESAKPVEPTVLRMQLKGAEEASVVRGLGQVAATANYFLGDDPTKWRTGIPMYRKVQLEGVYPGVDLLYYGNRRRLEYDFVVAAGADPELIRVVVEGAAGLRLDQRGGLVVQTPGSDVEFSPPTVYQTIHGASVEVSGGYVLFGDDEFGFRVAAYDRSQPLIIDPVLALFYSTYLGGSDRQRGDDIAVDAAGNAYTTGWTISVDFPTTSQAFQDMLKGAQSVYVTKFDPSGMIPSYSTYVGGSGNDVGLGIAVDGAGNAYVTGGGSSTDFPITDNPFQPANAGGADAFVFKLNRDGSALVYSTYLGGSGIADQSRRIAVDSAGAAYVAGNTDALDFPVTSGAFQTANAGGVDAFVTKLTPAGDDLAYSTYLGGPGDDFGTTVAVDSAGSAYVAGETRSMGFPTRNPIPGQSALNGPSDFFVTKLTPAGDDLVYSTYLGGSSGEREGWGIAVDASGNAHVTGQTGSLDFPTTAGVDKPVGDGSLDAFVTKLTPAGNAFVYSQYLGGSAEDLGRAVTLDGSGNLYVAGYTFSSDFPVRDELPGSGCGAFIDVVVAKFDPGGTRLYSTCLGGNSRDLARGVAVDAAGSVYLTGWTQSTNFPLQNPQQGARPGSVSSFVTKIVEAGVCGNGLLDPGESCDDGNLLDTDCCSSACTPVSDGTGCDDGDVCTETERCSAGVCGGGVPADCSDGNPCTDDLCDPVIGCFQMNNTVACEDGDACTTGDTCAGGACESGGLRNCGDGNPCTDDSCDAVLGCIVTNNTLPCDDGDACTDADGCSEGACTGGPPVDCDDGNPCTDDSCDSASGCVNTANTAPCDDGDVCTTGDTCSGGICVGGPTADQDADGLCDSIDNCPADANPGQSDGDADGPDGVGDVCDNCAQRFNPDQLNSDCPPNKGCQDGGDLCDACPAKSDNSCNASTAGNLDVAGGTVDLNGQVIVTVPPGALSEDTSVSVTDKTAEFKLKTGQNVSVYKVALRPSGAAFTKPVTVRFAWEDADDNGVVDGGPDESRLLIRKNSTNISQTNCVDAAHVPGGVCETATAADGSGNCASPADSVAKCCDRVNNTWDIEVCSFSELLLAVHAADLVPGRQKLSKDCVSEWAVDNPDNEPFLDRKGFVNFVQTCRDGDPVCDADGSADGRCVFEFGVCLNNDDDRLLKRGQKACKPSDVAEWKLRTPRPDSSNAVKAANGTIVIGAVSSFGAASVGGAHEATVTFAPAIGVQDLCSRLVPLEVPLGGAKQNKRGVVRIRAKSTTGAGVRDSDKLRLVCLPPQP